MGRFVHLARSLTPKSGAKAIVFLGRDNGLPWNAALDVNVELSASFGSCADDFRVAPVSEGSHGDTVHRNRKPETALSPFGDATLGRVPHNRQRIQGHTQPVQPSYNANSSPVKNSEAIDLSR